MEPLAPCDHLNLNSPVTLAMCAQWLLHWTEKIQEFPSQQKVLLDSAGLKVVMKRSTGTLIRTKM